MEALTPAKAKSSLREAASSVRARLVAPSADPSLVERVASLERDLQEHRELSMRVAQLTDLVQELLIPVADRDEERLHRLLEEYATTL